MPRVILEIAVDSLAEAVAAANAGADRLELCSDLDQHGLSASPGLLREIKSATSIPIVAMVRPRPGGFVHDGGAWREHLRDAEKLLEAGAEGLVFGALTSDREVDAAACREITKLAALRDTVFHRAFDLIVNPPDALRALSDVGITRILSAGMTPASTAHALGLSEAKRVDAPEALGARLFRLSLFAAGAKHEGIQFIACGGVRSSNVAQFRSRLHLTQLHSAARTGTPPKFSAAEVQALRTTIDASAP
jgi:copper homeostasis protein